MEEIARAKLNLALHVRGREPDGYHRIDTIFAFAEDGDLLRVEPCRELELVVTGPFAHALGAGSDNLVLRAAQALRERLGVEAGARLFLDKRLPVAAGIGGGSADAAAALRLLDRWWRCSSPPETLTGIARSLGADIPACLVSTPVRGRGRGDELEPVDLGALAGAPLLLANPSVPLATADVFRHWSGGDGGPVPEDLRAGRNDLEAPAFRLAPVVAKVLEALRGTRGASLARMSGSGATCFALYQRAEDRDAAAAAIAAAHPSWWLLSTRLA